MTAPAPITSDEFADGVEALLADKGLFAVEPKTVRGVDYDRSFLLSNMSVRDLFAAKERTSEEDQRELERYKACDW